MATIVLLVIHNPPHPGNDLHMCSMVRVPPEPAEHVASVATVPTVVTPGEPVVELGEFVLPCQVHLLI